MTDIVRACPACAADQVLCGYAEKLSLNQHESGKVRLILLEDECQEKL
jgi:hypothetical protein